MHEYYVMKILEKKKKKKAKTMVTKNIEMKHKDQKRQR